MTFYDDDRGSGSIDDEHVEPPFLTPSSCSFPKPSTDFVSVGTPQIDATIESKAIEGWCSTAKKASAKLKRLKFPLTSRNDVVRLHERCIQMFIKNGVGQAFYNSLSGFAQVEVHSFKYVSELHSFLVLHRVDQDILTALENLCNSCGLSSDAQMAMLSLLRHLNQEAHSSFLTLDELREKLKSVCPTASSGGEVDSLHESFDKAEKFFKIQNS